MKIADKFKILTYNIGIITKSLDLVMTEGIKKGDIKWLKHPYKDRYFADPFLWKRDENYFYILCEEYTFWEEKGKISLLIVDKGDFKVLKRKVVIEEETHLSFPYCKLGEPMVVPEASASGECVEYNLDLETYQVKSKKVIAQEGLIDSVFYKEGDVEWMYTGKTNIPSTELYVKKRRKGEQLFSDCGEKPVVSDNRRTRSAGDFFEWREKLYRPVQDCKGRYGRQTKILEIEAVGNKGYQAKEHITLNSFENPPYNETLHTFNVYEECIIVDGSFDFIRFPMKIYYKKFRFLFRGKRK